ncbi:hypothetical protein CCP1ISM_110007 [Azospirillaceae bacterium]
MGAFQPQRLTSGQIWSFFAQARIGRGKLSFCPPPPGSAMVGVTPTAEVPMPALLLACHAMTLPGGATPPEWVQLVPAGSFKGVDGRGPYRLADAGQVIAATMTARHGEPLCLCRDHDLELAAPKGGTAPAAGWIMALEARGDGIWGQVNWTPAGGRQVAEGEYRYISPAFLHAKNGTVTALQSVALTNNPNLPQLAALFHRRQEDASVDELLKQLRAALGLGDVLARRQELLGDRSGAALTRFDLSSTQQLEQAVAAGQPVTALAGVLAAERAQAAFTAAQQAYLTAVDREIAAREASVSSLQEGTLAQAQIARQFRDAAAGLALAETSPLGAMGRLEAARAQFEAAYAVVSTGTAPAAELDAARQRLLQVGQALPGLEQAVTGGTSSRAYDRVLQVFTQLGLTDDAALSTAERQLDSLNDQLRELRRTRQTIEQAGDRQQQSLSALASAMTSAQSTLQATLSQLQQQAAPAAPAAAVPSFGDLDWAGLSALRSWALQGTAATRAAYFAAEDRVGQYWGRDNYSYSGPTWPNLSADETRQSQDAVVQWARQRGYGGGFENSLNYFIQANNLGSAVEAFFRSYGQSRGWSGFEDGGIIGNGTWGRDSVLARYAGGGAVALAGGEGVVTAQATSAIGPAAIDYINRFQRLPLPPPTVLTLPVANGNGSDPELRTLLRQVLAALRDGTRANLIGLEAVVDRLEAVVETGARAARAARTSEGRR